MMKKGILAIILLTFICAVGYAQNKTADRYFNEKKYGTAARMYQKDYEKGKADMKTIERLAFCYKKLNRYEEAEKFYAESVKFGNADAESFKNYGQLLMNQNKFHQARKQFEEYAKRKEDDKLGKVLLASCDSISAWTKNASQIQTTNVEIVNSSYIETTPFPIGQKLMFCSDRVDSKKSKDELELEFYPFSIYIYDPSDSENPIQEFSKDINSRGNTETHAFLNPKGDKLYYTVVSNSGGAVGNMEIHFAHKNDDEWIKDDPFTRNNKKYDYANPVLGNDGETLYFASDRIGGEGGMDIFYCTKNGLLWSLPNNLGPTINTPGNEIPSYMDEDGTLYFASDNHIGFGGRDIFSTKKTGDTWAHPVNLGSPLNSAKDDFGFIKSGSTSGYFTSNRDNGLGEDDIYSFNNFPFSNEFYMNLTGSFKSSSGETAGKTLVLLDQNNVVNRTVITDENGGFVIDNVPNNSDFSVLVDEAPDDIPKDAEITITNEVSGLSTIATELQPGIYGFKSGNLQLIEDLSNLDDQGLPTIMILGQLEDKNDASSLADKRVYVVDNNGEIIASTYTDHLGQFQFEKLSMDAQYLFKLEEEDADLDVQIINTEGELIGRTVKNKDGMYVYHKFTINPSSNPDIRGVFKYGNLPADGVKLMLLDEEDAILLYATTDENGEFEFTDLKAGTKYKIQVDPSFKVPDNSAMFLMDKHTGMLVPVSKLANGEFKFETLSPIPPEELTLMDEEDFDLIPRQNVGGQVYSTGNKVVPAGLIVHLVDENGKVIAIAKTDGKGFFKFFNLPVDDQYLFSIPEEDDTFEISVINNNNFVIGNAKKNDNDQYVYHKFTINPSDRPDIRGIFKYGTLPANSVTLNLLDENDDIIEVTRTSALGEFTFKQLHAGKSYRIQPDKDENVPDNANIFLFDQHSGLMLPVSKLKNGEFKFETLSPIEPEELTLVEEEDENIVRFSFFAQLLSNENDVGEGKRIYVVDDNGNVINSAVTDKYGKFNYNKLPLQDEYLLRIEENDANMELFILSKDGDKVGALERNSNGDFVFNREELQNQVAETKKNQSTIKTEPSKEVLDDLPKEYKPYVNFGFNGYELDNDVRKNLDYLIAYLNRHKDLRVDISCHTDSRGSAEYNMYLSEMRGKNVKNYLTAKGIESRRVIIHAFGESKLLNDCRDNVDCPDSKHAENRRVELKYYR